MAVTLGSTTIKGVRPGADFGHTMGVEMAPIVANRFDLDEISQAIVDRYDGLVVFSGQIDDDVDDDAEMPRGWHFRIASCGYGGDSVWATAEILQAFGFGHQDDIYDSIATGGADAQYWFEKPGSILKFSRLPAYIGV